jgi:hypothetical protein
VVALVALVAAGPAPAYRKASRSQRRAIAAVLVPSNQPYFRNGRIAWAEVSTAGPYAVSWMVPRTPHGNFQPALLLLKHHGSRWRLLVDVYNQNCPGVPEPVLHDLRQFFVAKHPRFLEPAAVPGYRGCLARIAQAK